MLQNLGEFKLIEQIKKGIRPAPSVRVGIGDDAAVLRAPQGKDILFATDMLVEDKHFKISEATPYEIGWKAMAVNLSDIAAMGGIPTHAVVSVGLPPHLTPDFVHKLYQGLKAAAARFGAGIVGGDTNASEKLVISVALLGETEKGKAVTRSGAKLGDILFVSGLLGGSGVSRKHYHFIPKIEEARFLVKQFKINAMMDISDGLASDIYRLTAASGVGALISASSVPVSTYAGSLRHALEDGEDFELLFTVSAKEAARITMYSLTHKNKIFHPVGKIVEKKMGIKLVQDDGSAERLEEKGFDHFR